MSDLIKVDINPAALDCVFALTKIAIKAHDFDPSPVDIKLELAALPPEMLMKINEDVALMIQERKPKPDAK